MHCTHLILFSTRRIQIISYNEAFQKEVIMYTEKIIKSSRSEKGIVC